MGRVGVPGTQLVSFAGLRVPGTQLLCFLSYHFILIRRSALQQQHLKMYLCTLGISGTSVQVYIQMVPKEEPGMGRCPQSHYMLCQAFIPHMFSIWSL